MFAKVDGTQCFALDECAIADYPAIHVYGFQRIAATEAIHTKSFDGVRNSDMGET